MIGPPAGGESATVTDRRYSFSVSFPAAQEEQQAEAAEQGGARLGDDDELQAAALEIGSPAAAEAVDVVGILQSEVVEIRSIEGAVDERVDAVANVSPVHRATLGNKVVDPEAGGGEGSIAFKN